MNEDKHADPKVFRLRQDGARVLRFHSKSEADDGDKIREALRGVARELSRVVKFAECRNRPDETKEAARLCGDVMKLVHRVRP